MRCGEIAGGPSSLGFTLRRDRRFLRIASRFPCCFHDFFFFSCSASAVSVVGLGAAAQWCHWALGRDQPTGSSVPGCCCRRTTFSYLREAAEPACRILHTILCVVDCFAAVRLQLQLSPTLAEPRSVACSDLLGGLIQRSSSHIIPPPLARMPCCRAAWLGLFGHIGITIWLLRSAFELRAQMSSKLPLRLPLAVTCKRT